VPSITVKSLKDTIEKIIKKRGLNMMIVYPKVKKPLPADSKTPDTGAYLSDRIQGSYNPNHPDKKMEKDLGLAPFYWTHTWEDGAWVTEKPHLIKKA
jgi:hypothetical protein